jgi:opacity protein-like surface antigen
MRSWIRAVCNGLLLSGVGVVSVAQAQQMPPPQEEDVGTPLLWEVTPFVGYRMGGDFDVNGVSGGADLQDHGSFGFAVNLAIDGISQYELFYSRQETSFDSLSPIAPLDLDVEYLHIGGTLIVNEELPIAPYIAGGLGVTRLSPKGGSGSDDSRFSASLAGGVKLPVSSRLTVRLEARGYVTFIDTDSSVFCASGSFGGVCAIRADTDTFVQYELLAGVSFAF